ncbi:MAG: C4-type zinc ribbon domain-containing protein [Actinomycetota bacterium]|nr:C4-type zinc ribbon domain-containing protein [Actinomycetota bacterium]
MSAEDLASTPNAPKGSARILELQELDLSIDRLSARRELLESGDDVRVARARLADAEARLGELKLSIDEVSRNQRRLEQDVDSLDRKKQAENKRLLDGSVANPKELQAIQAEVQNLRGRKERIEDQLLELMERREELDSRLGPIEGEVAEHRDRVAEIEESQAGELVEIEQALAARSAEREALLPEFDEELLELYTDLRRQKKGVGAVALIDGVCQGCHQKLSPMYVERLKRTEGIRRCEYCRRILVFG